MNFGIAQIDNKEDAVFRDALLDPIKKEPNKDWLISRIYSLLKKNSNVPSEFTLSTVTLHFKVIRKDNLVDLVEENSILGTDYFIKLKDEGKEWFRTNQTYVDFFNKQPKVDAKLVSAPPPVSKLKKYGKWLISNWSPVLNGILGAAMLGVVWYYSHQDEKLEERIEQLELEIKKHQPLSQQ